APSIGSGKKRSSASVAPRHKLVVALTDEARVRDAVDRLELPFNALGVDPYGISKKQPRVFCATLRLAYRHYFSVQTSGIENVPMRGRAMIVGNHSGGIPIDAAMVIASCFLEREPPRLAQAMAERFVNRFPVASQ